MRRIPDRDTLLGRCDSPDPKEAVSFYTQLFGWKARQTIGADSSGKYFICTLRGRDVAAVG